MMSFDVAEYPAGLRRFLTEDQVSELGCGKHNDAAQSALAALDLHTAFAPHELVDPSMAAACHSGLWLLHNFLDESHTISQGIDNATGSFWHGIMHRREGDYSNAKYWFRRVGHHEVYDALATAAHEIAPEQFAAARWDAVRFVDLCEAVVRRGSADGDALQRVARREWELLFDDCFRHAIGAAV